MDSRADSIAASMAGKASSPLTSGCMRLPAVNGSATNRYVGVYLQQFVLLRTAIIIGPKAFIESLKGHPSLNPVGVICYDPTITTIEGLSNLGTLEDLPKIIERYKKVPNLTLVAERFVAQKLNYCFSCPVIAVDYDMR